VTEDRFEGGAPSFERFRAGWLLVYPDGAIGCRHVMTEDAARCLARLAGIDFPTGRREGEHA
jgi:hypothetical protein